MDVRHAQRPHASAAPPPSSAPAEDALFDAVVVGAGVVGVSTAYALARRGLSVALVDRAAEAGMGCSFANGAQLSYAYADSLGSPALLRNLPSMLLGSDPLFRVRSLFDPAMVAWGLRFLGACTTAAHDRDTAATLALALESQAALHALLETHALRFGYARPGKMHLHTAAETWAKAPAAARLKTAMGVEQRLLSPQEAAAIEPALGQVRGLVGVVHSPGDEVGDARRFTVALSELLARRYGVRRLFGAAVAAIGEADGARTLRLDDGRVIRGVTVVLAAGAASPALLRPLGVPAAVLAMKGWSFTAPLGPDAPQVSLTDVSRKLVFCRLDGQARVAGGAEFGGRGTEPDAAALACLTARAAEALPLAADYAAAGDGWAGLRPMTPHSTPIIRRAGRGLVLNTGHGMLGWTLAMGSAERCAALVLEEVR